MLEFTLKRNHRVSGQTALSATYSRDIVYIAKELLTEHDLCKKKPAELDKSGNKTLINQSRERYSQGL